VRNGPGSGGQSTAACYSTGRFAKRASVSVRTLRFYDQAGLLTPSGRTEAGYRLYSDADLPRLQQVLALKFLGLSLDEIKRCLATGPEQLQASLRQQKAMLWEKRAQLDTVLRAIDEAERQLLAAGPNVETVVRVIEVIHMQQNSDWVSKYFTPEQRAKVEELQQSSYSDSARAKLAARGPWTEEDQKRADEQWRAVNGELKRLTAAGADPSGPEGQAWAASFSALIGQFTGGDAEVAAGLDTFWRQHNALPASERPIPSPYTTEEQAFMDAALAASSKT
jgi:MerR family transcriptional regulator, thiopeptide resistance regulator